MDEAKRQELLEEAKRFWMHMAKTNEDFKRQIRKQSRFTETEIIGELENLYVEEAQKGE